MKTAMGNNGNYPAMSGYTTRLQTRTDYVMNAADYAGGKTMFVAAARRIPVDAWRECIIVARLHAVSPFNAGAAVALIVGMDGYTDEDPAAIWRVTGNPVNLVSWSQANDTLPNAKTGALAAPFGPLIQFFWSFTMATTPVNTTISVSIDMNLKGQ